MTRLNACWLILVQLFVLSGCSHEGGAHCTFSGQEKIREIQGFEKQRGVIVKALALTEMGVGMQDLISKLGKPIGSGNDVPFFGPVYGDETGKFLFAPLEPYRNSFRETKDAKIGIVIYFAIIGEIHMPPVYVYPIELRGQIATPPKSAVIEWD